MPDIGFQIPSTWQHFVLLPTRYVDRPVSAGLWFHGTILEGRLPVGRRLLEKLSSRCTVAVGQFRAAGPFLAGMDALNSVQNEQLMPAAIVMIPLTCAKTRVDPEGLTSSRIEIGNSANE